MSSELALDALHLLTIVIDKMLQHMRRCLRHEYTWPLSAGNSTTLHHGSGLRTSSSLLSCRSCRAPKTETVDSATIATKHLAAMMINCSRDDRWKVSNTKCNDDAPGGVLFMRTGSRVAACH